MEWLKMSKLTFDQQLLKEAIAQASRKAPPREQIQADLFGQVPEQPDPPDPTMGTMPLFAPEDL